jgi:heterodisulfide reductase subunit B
MAEILLEAKDKNADFLIVHGLEDLYLFDRKQKDVERLIGRDISIPVLTKSQFIAILEGEKDRKSLGFHNHKIDVTFL